MAISKARYKSIFVAMLTEAAHVGEVRDQLIEARENASYPVRDVEVSERSDDVTEVAATLVSTAVEPAELDAVATALEASPLVSHVSWSSTTDD
jgi:putative Mg2+ transporter-C (MgtC) family protein